MFPHSPATRDALLRTLVSGGLLLALLAAPFMLTPAPTFAQSDSCPAVDAPVDPADPSVIVNAPAPGDSVESPVPISGEARVFEANVSIIIFDANGEELANTFTTAAEAAPALAPFGTQIVFDVSSTQDGCIWVFEESAEDGSPRNVVAVPVTLLASEDPPDPAPTGDGGIGANASTLVLVLTLVGAVWVVLAARVSTAVRTRAN